MNQTLLDVLIVSSAIPLLLIYAGIETVIRHYIKKDKTQ